MLKPTAGELPFHGWESSFHEFVEENERSLKERFNVCNEKPRVRWFTATALYNVWNRLLTSIAVLSALIGLISLLVPSLRCCQFRLFSQFFREIGLL